MFGWFSKRKRKPAPLAPLRHWLAHHRIDEASVVFTIYDDARLIESHGSMMVVGTARRIGAPEVRVGFLVEIDRGAKVLLERFFIPYEVATWHGPASQEARREGTTLLRRLVVREQMSHTRRAA